jgi:hypothetical protein
MDNLTIPEGNMRVKRNIAMLVELSSPYNNMIVSIISSLNRPPNTNNYNAQKMLEKLRQIESKQGMTTLRVAVNTLFTYFKDKPNDSKTDNYRFNLIIDAFKTNEIKEICELLNKTPILQKNDETARKNIYYEQQILNTQNKFEIVKSGIVAIKEPSFALEILKRLQRKNLLTGDSAQDNFEKINTHNNLLQLQRALNLLEEKNELNQSTFEKISEKNVNSFDKAKRLLEDLEPLNALPTTRIPQEPLSSLMSISSPKNTNKKHQIPVEYIVAGTLGCVSYILSRDNTSPCLNFVAKTLGLFPTLAVPLSYAITKNISGSLMYCGLFTKDIATQSIARENSVEDIVTDTSIQPTTANKKKQVAILCIATLGFASCALYRNDANTWIRVSSGIATQGLGVLSGCVTNLISGIMKK